MFMHISTPNKKYINSIAPNTEGVNIIAPNKKHMHISARKAKCTYAQHIKLMPIATINIKCIHSYCPK